MDQYYTWGLAIDDADPGVWYISASLLPALAHLPGGDAQAMIYRKRGDALWQALGGDGTGLVRPLRAMPYALLALRARPHTLIAGIKSGDLPLTEDAGDTWQTGLPSILSLSESAG